MVAVFHDVLKRWELIRLNLIVKQALQTKISRGFISSAFLL